MNLAVAIERVDQLVHQVVGAHRFSQDQYNQLVKYVVDCLAYDPEISREDAKLLVTMLMTDKFTASYQFNPESLFNQRGFSDRVRITCAADLVSHQFDYAGDTFRESKYLERQHRIELLKAIPQAEQKSDAWFAQREKCLTATAVAAALDECPHTLPAELLLAKCGRGKPFVENLPVHHGKKYEQIGTLYYSYRYNVTMAEYGLLQHDTIKHIGASPDGICEMYNNDGGLTKLVGRLLEIKFPFWRRVAFEGRLNGDKCPHYYYMQVQTQLFVTGMPTCDFLQCKIIEYNTWDEYLQDTAPGMPGLSARSGLEKGCLIQLFPKDRVTASKDQDTDDRLLYARYIYPPRLHMTPEEIKTWLAEQMINFHTHPLHGKYLIDRVIYWKLIVASVNTIHYEKESFEQRFPELEQFWDLVKFYRKHPKQLDQLHAFIKSEGDSQSAKIFKKAQEAYQSKYPDDKREPLYQSTNPWREEYNKKKRK